MKHQLHELRAQAITRLKVNAFDARWRHALRFADALLGNQPLRDTMPLHALRELTAWLPEPLRAIAAEAAYPTFLLRPQGPWQYVQPWTVAAGEQHHVIETSHEGMSLIWLACASPGAPVDAAALLGRHSPPPGITRKEREAWYAQRAAGQRQSAAVNARHAIKAATGAIREVVPSLADNLVLRVSRSAEVRYVGERHVETF